MFGANLQELAKSRQVIAVHLQAHGRTADVDRPMGYEAMADDIAGLIGHLGFERSDVMGYSLGGGVSLQTAIRHPEVVRKLVLVSSPFKREGWYPEVLAGMQMGPEAAESMTQSPLYDLYPNADWRALITKLSALLRRDYNWSKDVEALKPQTMLVYADADAVRMAHIVEFFGLLGGGKRDAGLDGTGMPESWLAIVPGETHYDVALHLGCGENKGLGKQGSDLFLRLQSGHATKSTPHGYSRAWQRRNRRILGPPGRPR